MVDRKRYKLEAAPERRSVSREKTIAITVSLLCAAASAVIAQQMMAARPVVERVVEREVLQPAAPLPSIQVLVARMDVEFGAELDRSTIKLVDWPSHAVPEGVFHGFDAFEVPGAARYALSRLKANEPILLSKVTDAGERASLASRLRDGMKAATIRVDDVNGVAGFVLPGEVVDILFTRRGVDDELEGQRPQGRSFATTLLRQVRVLAVDQSASEGEGEPRVASTVTVEVSLANAQKLALAGDLGTLGLVLSKPIVSQPTINLGPITLADLNVGPPVRSTTQKEQQIAQYIPNQADLAADTEEKRPGRSVTVVRATEPTDYPVEGERDD